MVDYVGQQLGNYRLIRLLGEGGFAQVYLGEHIYLNTQAAIKILRTKLASDDVEWFRTEARTIARLVHPNIVRVLDFDVQDETPFWYWTTPSMEPSVNVTPGGRFSHYLLLSPMSSKWRKPYNMLTLKS